MKSKTLSLLRLAVPKRAGHYSPLQACLSSCRSGGIGLLFLFLCTSCSVNEQTDRTGSLIRARATTQASATVSRAATDVNGLQALVLASQTAGSYANPYAKGTMTFGTDAVGYDADGFEGTQQLPADGSPLHLCALYPVASSEFSPEPFYWELADRTASFTFLGLDDVMTAGGQRIEEGGEQTASFNFRHLLTRINIKAYAANEEVAKAFSGIGRMHFTKPQGNAPFGCQVTVNLADGTADTRTAFSNEISQWLVWHWNPAGVDDPSYINFVLTNAVGASNAQLVGTTLMPPLIATGSNDLEITATVKDHHWSEKVCTVSLPITGGADTQGKAYTITLKFTTQGVEATATADAEWEDNTLTTVGGSQDLSREGTANCYIVTEADMSFTFDATKRGNGYESMVDPNVKDIAYATLPSLNTATEARIIWQMKDGAKDVIDNVTLRDGKVTFTTGSAREGNAVIGIFASSDANAECLWSWHIWKVSGKLPTDFTCTKRLAAGGDEVQFEMMDRNLGAYNNTPGDVRSIGLLYQWGRKDPFPGPASFSGGEISNIYGSYNDGTNTGTWTGNYSIKSKQANETQTEAWAVKHPTIYITCAAGTSQNDWVTSANTFLWGTPWQSGGIPNGQYGSYNRNSGTKSIYDPCPVGYRVPPQDTWNNVVESNITWSNNGGYMGEFNGAWFPEFLNRKSADGSFSTYSGSYWLSSSDSGMNHYSTNMTLNSSYNLFSSANITACGDAKSVRCVSE